MKKVKFKAYDNFEDQTYEVIEISFEKNKVFTLFRGGLRNVYDFDDVVILPHTGLLDNNRKEIYERDRLEKGDIGYIVSYDDFNAQFVGVNQENESERKPLRELIDTGFVVKNT
ncbi:YopX family protein [Niallia sp. FSL W8-0635]|uniref:YopX family protein n=1 Tax=Niallia sp. FSL W8-0635 TaxID=2975337 RepID=UPI0030F55057